MARTSEHASEFAQTRRPEGHHAGGATNEIMNAIPHIIAAGLILILAYVVSRFVANLVVEVVAGTGVDEIPAKLDVQRFLGTTKVSCIVGYLIVVVCVFGSGIVSP